jgi:hypothetical protein
VSPTRAVVDGILTYAVLDWEGITDIHGRQVPFKKDLVRKLPEEAKSELVKRLFASDPTADLLGNSSNGSTATSPSED